VAQLGLFPLPLVLVPTERVPLHIFEPRYRELIGECIERDDDFGIVLLEPSGELRHVGTRANVTQVLGVLPDGRLNVVVEGGDRFRLLSVGDERSFAVGTVEEVVDDEGEVADPADVERALDLYARLQVTAGDSRAAPDAESALLDWELAARVEFPAERKQELLELTSTRRRFGLLAELLEHALTALEVEGEIHRRASTNGKVTPLSP
jgi:Lon protease-like protein